MRGIICILFVIFFWSCNKPYIKKPDDLLSKSEMVDILVDLYLSQQTLNAKPTHTGDIIQNLAKNSAYIFERHGTTHKMFEDSYKFYFTDPKTYNSILDDVKDELQSQLSKEEKTKQLEMQSQTENSVQ